MARGDVGAAETFFRRTEKAIRDLHLPYTKDPETARLYLFWAEGLLENGRPEAALDIARRGFRLSSKADLPVIAAQTALLMAKAAFLAGDPGSCRRALAQFDTFAEEEVRLERERVEKFALLGRLELASGDRRAAEEALEGGLRSIEMFASNSDASVQSYLWIGECDELRQLMHDLTTHDPALGYGAELFWQDFYGSLGRAKYAKQEAGSPPESKGDRRASGGDERQWATAAFEATARAARARISERGAVHSVYVCRGDEIWRWTASPDSIRRETLGCPTDEVKRRAIVVWNAMALDHPDPGRFPSRALSENLRWLALSLLPPEVAQATSSPADGPFLITTDGFLSGVPFEAFDVGGEEQYTPLLLRRDVAYLRRSAGADRPPSEEPGVILANAATSHDAARRRLPRTELVEALREGGTLAALEPDSRMLVGEDATKAGLRSLWQDAPFLYIATHMLRDPQVPYLMLVPLAGPAEPAAPDAGYLEFDDIRAADFGRCEIVVLSGCASGAPYVDIRNAAPSLGDAFLDAGARSVVQTFWDVKDEDAGQLMARFIPMWRNPAMDDVRALNEARRFVFRKSGGMENISAWASFYIETRGP
jgi:hypothetical protein